jgi:hypothetical protein
MGRGNGAAGGGAGGGGRGGGPGKGPRPEMRFLPHTILCQDRAVRVTVVSPPSQGRAVRVTAGLSEPQASHPVQPTASGRVRSEGPGFPSLSFRVGLSESVFLIQAFQVGLPGRSFQVGLPSLSESRVGPTVRSHRSQTTEAACGPRMRSAPCASGPTRRIPCGWACGLSMPAKRARRSLPRACPPQPCPAPPLPPAVAGLAAKADPPDHHESDPSSSSPPPPPPAPPPPSPAAPGAPPTGRAAGAGAAGGGGGGWRLLREARFLTCGWGRGRGFASPSHQSTFLSEESGSFVRVFLT